MGLGPFRKDTCVDILSLTPGVGLLCGAFHCQHVVGVPTVLLSKHFECPRSFYAIRCADVRFLTRDQSPPPERRCRSRSGPRNMYMMRSPNSATAVPDLHPATRSHSIRPSGPTR